MVRRPQRALSVAWQALSVAWQAQALSVAWQAQAPPADTDLMPHGTAQEPLGVSEVCLFPALPPSALPSPVSPGGEEVGGVQAGD